MTAGADREDVLAFLDAHGIAHSTVEHPPVFRVEDGREIKARLPGAHTKNLFLKDARDQLWLVCAGADTRVDLKALPLVVGAARLSFGSSERLQRALGVAPGSVTLFALVNDADRRVRLVLDRALLGAALVNFHPMTNTATTAISREGLLRFLEALDRGAQVVDFAGDVPRACAPLRCGPASRGPS